LIALASGQRVVLNRDSLCLEASEIPGRAPN
jgi:hypothetical protein